MLIFNKLRKVESYMKIVVMIGVIFLVNMLLFLVFIVTRQYNPFLVSIHIFSLIMLWVIVLARYPIKNFLIRKKTDVLIIFLLFLLAFGVRLYHAESITPGMYGDELSVAVTALTLLNKPDLPPFVGDYSHPTPLLHVTAGSIQLFGYTLTAIRLPSIIFGSLTVVAFYILVRLFLPMRLAFLGALLMLAQYINIVLSRLAYEPIASLFFQVLAVIFLIIYFRTKDTLLLIALALSLGAGLYTYLNFRVFVVVITALTTFYILKKDWKRNMQYVSMFFLLLFLSAMPLISYALVDFQGFWGRSSEISILSRDFTTSQLVEELWANTYRTILLPFLGIPGSNPPFIGDPNPGKNPSGVTMFDPLTTILAIVGFIYFWKRKRELFWLSFLLLFPPLISDIFSTEVIPLFHYYGLGHPNTLRVSGLITVVLFGACFGLVVLEDWFIKHKLAYQKIILSVLILLISVINFWWYFGQQSINRKFYLYNYKVNHADILQMIKYLNTLPTEKVSMTEPLANNNDYIDFFLKSSLTVSRFTLSNSQNLLEVIKKSDATVIEVNESTIETINELLASGSFEREGYLLHEIKGIVDQPDMVIFVKSNLMSGSSH